MVRTLVSLSDLKHQIAKQLGTRHIETSLANTNDGYSMIHYTPTVQMIEKKSMIHYTDCIKCINIQLDILKKTNGPSCKPWRRTALGTVAEARVHWSRPQALAQSQLQTAAAAAAELPGAMGHHGSYIHGSPAMGYPQAIHHRAMTWKFTWHDSSTCRLE